MLRRSAIVLGLALIFSVAGWLAPPETRLELAPRLTAADAGDTRVYVTRTGKKYHRDGCSSLSRSRIPMRLADAVRTYGPCGNCAPPLLAAGGPGRGIVSAPAVKSSRCQSTTKKGTQCKRTAKAGTAYCWQHAR